MNKQIKAAKLTLCKQVVSKPGKVTIHQLPTGVRGLDDILGGGIPEFSFNIIAGSPGCGKTMLAAVQQVIRLAPGERLVQPME